MQIQQINEAIKTVDPNLVSDGYHTFGELYNHRIQLFIVLCQRLAHQQKLDERRDPELATRIKQWGYAYPVWRTTTHSDGSVWDGWFLLGIGKKEGSQITYHLPISEWNNCYFAEELEQAPPFDGHTSADVLDRLKRLE